MGTAVAYQSLSQAAASTMATAATTAAVTGPIAALGSSMMMNPLIMNPGASLATAGLATATTAGPGLLSGFGLNNFGIGDALFLGTSLLSAGQSYGQGQTMQRQYDIQESQELAKTEILKFNAVQASVNRFDKLRRIQAANLAQSYAGGVSGLDGSALLMRMVNDQEYGKDEAIDSLNLQNLINTGNVNAGIYATASDRAPRDAMLNAGIKLGTAAYTYSRLG